MTRRGWIRVVAFMTAALAVMTGMAMNSFHDAQEAERRLEYGYQRAFADLVNGVQQIDTALQKGNVATTPAMSAMFGADIARQSAAASAALSALPFESRDLAKTAQFLSQVGDYALTVSRTATAGKPIAQTDREQLTQLSQTAKALAGSLNGVLQTVHTRQVSLAEVMNAAVQEAPSAMGDSIKEMEAAFPEYASLIYDGPFSDHISQRTAKAIENEPEVSADAALKIAEQLVQSTLKPTGEGSNLPIDFYSFSGQSGGDTIDVRVSKKGGRVLSVSTSRYAGEVKLSPEQAIKKARETLDRAGYTDLQHSYYYNEGGELFINFHAVQDGILCYPDLIKITIDLADGAMMQLDATGYLMNHAARALQPPKLTVGAAETRARATVRVQEARRVIIPSNGLNDVACVEVQGKGTDGENYLLYYNEQSGVEERILILLEDENGVLVV